MTDYIEFNSRMWDEWSTRQIVWTQPISHEEYERSKKSPLELYLTPQKPIPAAWFQGLGKKVLGLASGGGQQGALLSAHGYRVTIMDNSRRQLEADRLVAEREGYAIDLIKADMSKPFPFENESFDWIINPVSNCYIEDLQTMWQESYRILRKGGALMTGFTNPIMYLFEDEDLRPDALTPLACKNPLPYNGRLLSAQGQRITTEEGYQFSHTLEAQLGGQTKAGFLIKDLYEDSESDNRLGFYTNLYIADLAIKP